MKMPRKVINNKNNYYGVFFKSIYYHGVEVCIPRPACAGQRTTLWSQLSPLILIQVPGIEQIGRLACQVSLSDELSCH